MVDDEKLMEWIQGKLDQGVSEDRIRKSLRNTGHDPSLVEKAKDPFSGQKGPKDSEQPQRDSESQNVEETAEEQETGREAPEKNEEKGQSRRDDPGSNDRDDEVKDFKKNERKNKRWNDTRNKSKEDKNNFGPQNKGDQVKNNRQNNRKQNIQNQRQSGGKGANKELRDQRKRQEHRPQESDGGLSLPSISAPDMPSAPKPDLSALPLKSIAVISVLILFAIGGFAAYQAGMVPNISLPEIQNDDQDGAPPDSGTERTSAGGCPNVGVRVKSASSDGNSVTARVAVFNSEIEGIAELYSDGNIVASETFSISDERTVNFNKNGDEIVFRPVGCKRIRDSFSLN